MSKINNSSIFYQFNPPVDQYTWTRDMSQHDTRIEPEGSYTINNKLGPNLVTELNSLLYNQF